MKTPNSPQRRQLLQHTATLVLGCLALAAPALAVALQSVRPVLPFAFFVVQLLA